MLTRFQLILIPDTPCRPRAEWSYPLYASLLQRAPEEFGEMAHRDEVTPISQFLAIKGADIIWNISLLGEACERTLGPLLETIDGFDLHREGVHLSVSKRSVTRISDVDELLEMAATHSGRHHLQFRTPAAFKHRGKYINLPTTRLIVQNLIKKWNGCILECPIDDEDGGGMEALAAGLRCGQFHLKSRDYYLKGHPVSGFVGEITIKNELTGFQRQLADALLLFAEFSGIGMKTTLGMGGITRS